MSKTQPPNQQENNRQLRVKQERPKVEIRLERVVFGSGQTQILLEAFSRDQYMDRGNNCKNLAKQIGITQSQVKIWFLKQRFNQRMSGRDEIKEDMTDKQEDFGVAEVQMEEDEVEEELEFAEDLVADEDVVQISSEEDVMEANGMLCMLVVVGQSILAAAIIIPLCLFTVVVRRRAI